MQEIKLRKNKRSVISQIVRGVSFCLIGAFSFVIIFVFIIPGLLGLFAGKDITPVDDSMMVLQIIDISESENAFYDLNKLYDADKMSEVIDMDGFSYRNDIAGGYLESDTWDQNAISDVLATNEEALGYFTDAAAKGRFQSPYTNDPSEISIYMPVVAMNPWRKISHLSGIKAINLARNGQSAEALDEAMKIVIVGDSIMKSQDVLICYLVGIAIQNTGLDVLQKIISMTSEDYSGLDKYRVELEKYRPKANSTPFIIGYLAHKKVLLEIRQSTDKYMPKVWKFLLNNKFYFKPNLTVSYIFDSYAKLVEESNKECSDMRGVAEERDMSLAGMNFFKVYFTENAVGKKLVNTSFVALNNVLDKKCALEEKFGETIVMMNRK